MVTVAVIGGGASGMMAAVTAASRSAKVIMIEHKDRVGKKILSTGNGRCNFTNIYQDPACYHCTDPLFPWHIIEKFNAQDTISFFLKLGIYSKNRNGYIYPNSDQASAVLDVLRMEMERLHVKVMTEAQCSGIIPGKKGFKIQTNKGIIKADKVILCTGSKAAPVTGSDGSGYDIAKKLGHRILPVLPALVQLRCEEKYFKSIAGVRVNGKVSVWSDGICEAEDTGEIQITNYGISGIPVFQISRYVSALLYNGKSVEAVIDYMPDFSNTQMFDFLKIRSQTRPEKTAVQFLTGLFHKKLSDLWITQAGIDREKQCGNFSDIELRKLNNLIKHTSLNITGTNSYEQAQVCAGGVDTSEINPDTLESIYVPGLYFAGEILDVDGMCGGYNLQWAWSSGYITGIHVCD